ncbi:MAG: hypothetical protein L0K47_10075, partial [Acidipropionibacterium jensenii]|uniref:hypothetical protein n=1 Tax=Acidipropionibacterium jensenii TaxID=1749 RepID=UPI0026479167
AVSLHLSQPTRASAPLPCIRAVPLRLPRQFPCTRPSHFPASVPTSPLQHGSGQHDMEEVNISLAKVQISTLPSLRTSFSE